MPHAVDATARPYLRSTVSRMAPNGQPEKRGAAPRSDRLICCCDAVGRRCSMIVFGDPCGVVVVSPPGEVAVLSDDEVETLRAALRAASIERRDRQASIGTRTRSMNGEHASEGCAN